MHYLNLTNSVQKAFAKQANAIEKLFPGSHPWVSKRESQNRSETEEQFCIYAYAFDGTSRNVCSFKMSYLPGCCGTLVLNYRIPNCDKKKIKPLVRRVLQIQEAAAKAAKFTQLLATCLVGSADESLYLAASWSQIAEYRNVKTGNTVRMYTKIIDHPAPGPTAFGEGA